MKHRETLPRRGLTRKAMLKRVAHVEKLRGSSAFPRPYLQPERGAS